MPDRDNLPDWLPPGLRARLRTEPDRASIIARFMSDRKPDPGVCFAGVPLPKRPAGTAEKRKEAVREAAEISDRALFAGLEDQVHFVAEVFLDVARQAAQSPKFKDERGNLARIAKGLRDALAGVDALGPSARHLMLKMLRQEGIDGDAAVAAFLPTAERYEAWQYLNLRVSRAARASLDWIDSNVLPGGGAGSFFSRAWGDPRIFLALSCVNLMLGIPTHKEITGDAGGALYKVTAATFEYAFGPDSEAVGKIDNFVQDVGAAVRNAQRMEKKRSNEVIFAQLALDPGLPELVGDFNRQMRETMERLHPGSRRRGRRKK